MATKKPPRERETKVVGAIRLQARKWLGLELHRRNTGAARFRNKTGAARFVRFSEPGASDLFGVIPRGPHRGKALELEVKRKGERPTELQLKWLREQDAAGAISLWSDSARWAMQVLEIILAGGLIRWDETGDEYDVITAPKGGGGERAEA